MEIIPSFIKSLIREIIAQSTVLTSSRSPGSTRGKRPQRLISRAARRSIRKHKRLPNNSVRKRSRSQPTMVRSPGRPRGNRRRKYRKK